MNVLYLHPQTGSDPMSEDDFVAQLVEQMTLNHWVEGSSPSEVTKNGSRLNIFRTGAVFL